MGERGDAPSRRSATTSTGGAAPAMQGWDASTRPIDPHLM
jgi:hypothetical protein